MERQIAFDATKCSMSFLGAFFAEVAKEVGEDKAAEMYGKQGKAFGDTMAGIIKRHAGQSDAAEQVQSELEKMYESFGLTAELKRENGRLIIDVHRCPMYEGFLEAGLEPTIIHKMCQAWADSEGARMKELLPRSSHRLTEFRTSADGCCQEEITLGL